jgi:predicted transposase YbfD/YdcC
MTTHIAHSFSSIEDPRIDRKKLHTLSDILVLTICAMLSGANGYEAIEEFGHNKKHWLKTFLPLKNGIPSHDCIRYVLIRLSVEELQSCFIKWVDSIRNKIPEVVAVDGKTSRRSHNKRKGISALHLVSAWAVSNRLVLGQEATEEKSNEITAIPALLKLLELKGCIITIDAMGCQRDIAKQIIHQEADYIFGLKGNQGLLHEAVEDYFQMAVHSEFSHIAHDYHEEVDKGHGRLEIRKHWILEDLNTLPKVEQWEGLRSIGMVQRECTIGDKTTLETRYFINSIKPDAKAFAHAVRSHWGVENSLHWCLDVTFREDDSRIRTGNAPAIMSTLRHICLNLLQKESSKMSINKKRLKAAWNDGFRYKLLFGQ